MAPTLRAGGSWRVGSGDLEVGVGQQFAEVVARAKQAAVVQREEKVHKTGWELFEG